MAASRNDLGQRLLEIKRALEEKKSKRSELQGEHKGVMKQLKQEFGVDSLEDAERRIREEEQELQKMEEEIRAQIYEVEELMEEGE